jgi:hypothetical protein
VDIELDSGEFVAIMGPSGSGKSTLLHVLGGLEPTTSGEIWLRGQRVDGLSMAGWAILRRRHVGFVFQFFNLLSNMTVADNVELPALLAGASPRQARRRREELLAELGIADKAGTAPARLSGGEQQRVALARGSRLNVWNTNPISLLRTRASSSSFIVETSSPLSQYSPAFGVSRQPTRFMNVDLPEPDGPMMATYSLRRMARSTPRSALTISPPMSYSRFSPRVTITQSLSGFAPAAWTTAARSAVVLRATSSVCGLTASCSRSSCRSVSCHAQACRP